MNTLLRTIILSVSLLLFITSGAQPPVANFYAKNSYIGYGDHLMLYDSSVGNVTAWKWWMLPTSLCSGCTVPPYYESVFSNDSAQNTHFVAGIPGKYSICLKVKNASGFDSICKVNFLNVLNSYNTCGNSISLGEESAGYLFGNLGPDFPYNRNAFTSCQGFLISPCTDSVKIYIDRLKLYPSDSIAFYNGTSSSAPLIAKIGGSNASLLPLPVKSGIQSGRSAFVRVIPGTASIPSGYDSAGFSIRWISKPANYPKPHAAFTIPDTIFSNTPVTYQNMSTGSALKFKWDTDGNSSYDSTSASPVRTHLLTTTTTRSICLVAYNCSQADTACKSAVFMPPYQKPSARFDASLLSGSNLDTFLFVDKSYNGPAQWAWTFTPSGVYYLNGTTQNSRNPMVRFTQATTYTIKLRVTNSFGSDSLTKTGYVSVYAYPSPQVFNAVNPSDGVGISRVTLPGIDTVTNAFIPAYQYVTGNQLGCLYRGQKVPLSIFRPGTTQPLDCKVWIDFNKNGSFTDAAETVISAYNSSVTVINDSVTIPQNQPIGYSVMRIGVTYAGTTLNPQVAYRGIFRDFNVGFPADVVPPVISLKGSATVYTNIHAAYQDAGVTAIDNIEGDISSRYTIIGVVDTAVVGSNILKYAVRDLYGNVSDTISRTVFVVLNQAGPTLTLAGDSVVYSEVNEKYNEPGYQASDNGGADLTSMVIVSGLPDTTRLGNYTVTYAVSDAFARTTQKTRLVVIRDTKKPVITPRTGNPYTHLVKIPIDLSAVVKVTDNYDKNVLPLHFGSVNVNVLGETNVVYKAFDNSGNKADSLVMHIVVADTLPPVPNAYVTPLKIRVFDPLIDTGISFTDNYWPSASITISRAGTVNTSKLGSYVKTYTGRDGSGNTCQPFSRTFEVIDDVKPVIKLLGNSPFNLHVGDEYVEPGVSLEDNYNSDDELRPYLNITNPLPHNGAGKPYAPSSGYFTIKYNVHDEAGNVASEVTRTIFAVPTAIDETEARMLLVDVYPVPFSDHLNLVLGGNPANEVEIEICDMAGKTVSLRRLGIVKNTATIDVSTVSPGAYVLKISSGGAAAYRKISKLN
jgi:PKD repeat protein